MLGAALESTRRWLWKCIHSATRASWSTRPACETSAFGVSDPSRSCSHSPSLPASPVSAGLTTADTLWSPDAQSWPQASAASSARPACYRTGGSWRKLCWLHDRSGQGVSSGRQTLSDPSAVGHRLVRAEENNVVICQHGSQHENLGGELADSSRRKVGYRHNLATDQMLWSVALRNPSAGHFDAGLPKINLQLNGRLVGGPAHLVFGGRAPRR